MAESSGSSNNRRLLRLKLTDGHSDITAIEYSHIPTIPDDIVPSTKVFPFSMTIKIIADGLHSTIHRIGL